MDGSFRSREFLAFDGVPWSESRVGLAAGPEDDRGIGPGGFLVGHRRATPGVCVRGRPLGKYGLDPAQVARDVLLDQDFWWKRVEPRSVSTSWLDAPIEAVRDFLARTLRAILEWLRDFSAISAASSRAIRRPSRP